MGLIGRQANKTIKGKNALWSEEFPKWYYNINSNVLMSIRMKNSPNDTLNRDMHQNDTYVNKT